MEVAYAFSRACDVGPSASPFRRDKRVIISIVLFSSAVYRFAKRSVFL